MWPSERELLPGNDDETREQREEQSAETNQQTRVERYQIRGGVILRVAERQRSSQTYQHILKKKKLSSG
jgi:hypothetical protein